MNSKQVDYYSKLKPSVRRLDPLLEEARAAGGGEHRFGQHGDLLDEWIGPLFDDPLAMAEEVARKTAANHSSMLQDVLRNAPTEIDAICGAVVRTAQTHEIDTFANWACWKLIKALS